MLKTAPTFAQTPELVWHVALSIVVLSVSSFATSREVDADNWGAGTLTDLDGVTFGDATINAGPSCMRWKASCRDAASSPRSELLGRPASVDDGLLSFRPWLTLNEEPLMISARRSSSNVICAISMRGT